jgi:hypothetical protein
MSPILYAVLGAALVLFLLVLRARLSGFMAQTPADYAQSAPPMDLRQHLTGDIKCDGVIYGPLGKVVSRFTGDFVAAWDGDKGIMQEHFQYDSGNTQDREWRLELGHDGAVRAEADDLLGTGHGAQSGATLCLKYRIRLPDEAGGHVLNVTDWMYLAPSGVIVNRSQFRKFGIKVAELIATMRKVEAA